MTKSITQSVGAVKGYSPKIFHFMKWSWCRFYSLQHRVRRVSLTFLVFFNVRGDPTVIQTV